MSCVRKGRVQNTLDLFDIGTLLFIELVYYTLHRYMSIKSRQYLH